MAADIVRVSFGWLAALLIGHRANERFIL